MMDDVGRPPAADAASVDSGACTAGPGSPHLQVRTLCACVSPYNCGVPDIDMCYVGHEQGMGCVNMALLGYGFHLLIHG